MIQLGDRGPSVLRLQKDLQLLGFYTGAMDGVFGQITRIALWNLQNQYRITEEGFGLFGPATQKCLKTMRVE